jgi:hypothetical protein
MDYTLPFCIIKRRKRDPIDLKEDPLALVNSLLKDKDKKKKKKGSDHHHKSRKDTKEYKSSGSSGSSKKVCIRLDYMV